MLLQRSLAAKQSITLLAFEHMSGRAEVLLERRLVIKRPVTIVAVVAVVHWSVGRRVEALLERLLTSPLVGRLQIT
jgi:hypothetical protein